MKNGVHAVAVERFLEARRSQEWVDLRRLPFDRGVDRRVVQHGDLLRRAQPRQRGLELQRLLDRLVDELLDDLLAPRAELPAPEAAAEAFHAGEADALDLVHAAVEHRHAGVREDLHDLVLVAGLEVVIAEDADGRDAQRRGDLLGQDLRLLDRAVVGEVAAHQEHVGLTGRRFEQRVHASQPRLFDVDVGDRGDPERLFFHHLCPSISIPFVHSAISSSFMFPSGSSRASR